jgi:hypothetical protein
MPFQATKFRQKEKAQIEGTEFKEGGQRDWVQVKTFLDKNFFC